MNLPILILVVVLLLVAVRRVGAVRIQIWQAMLFGAVAALLTGSISVPDAVNAIDWDVMVFLFGMFLVGRAMIASGFLAHVVEPLFLQPTQRYGFLFIFIFLTGFASALLMNDTLAIVGVPLALGLARRFGLDPKMVLMALALSITTGSVMTPIGNPQNLLIAISSDMPNPFLAFLSHLALPTVLSLGLVYFAISVFYRKNAMQRVDVSVSDPSYDADLAAVVKVALVILSGMVVIKIALAVFGEGAQIRLSYIAVMAALPILFARSRFTLIKEVDWPTLIFFAAMFVLMQAVWQSGFFQQWLSASEFVLSDPLSILAISAGMSQLISNVPLVALYLPLLGASSDTAYLALAAGSTLAGNMMIIGAASNVIIVQLAERQGVHISFWEFARIGVPLTLLQLSIFWLFLV